MRLLRTEFFVVPSLATLLVSSPALAQAEMPVVSVAEGEKISHTGYASETSKYMFDVQAGQPYLIELTQSGLDFTIDLERPGVGTRTFNSPLRRDESEFVLIPSGASEKIRIIVRSDELTDATGTHTLAINALPTGAQADPRTEPAWRLTSEAAAAASAADGGMAEAAKGMYATVAAVWEQIGNRRRQAQALYSIGMLEYWHIGSWESAVEYADRAAEIYAELGEQALYANAIFLRAYARLETASPENRDQVFRAALASFDEALEIHTTLGNEFEQAHIRNFIGITYWYRADGAYGDFETARKYYGESAALFASIGEWREELNALQNIVVLDYAEGKRLQAIESFKRMLRRLPTGRDPSLRATMLGNLGTVQLAFGNIDDSLQAHSEAYEIYVESEDVTGQGYALKNIGQTYFALGETDIAKRYLENARSLAEKSKDQRTEANIVSILGKIAYADGDYQTALERHRESILLSSATEEAVQRRLLLARDLAALGRHDEAISEAMSVLDQSRSEVTQADALQQLASSHIETGETARGLELLDDAGAIYENLQLSAHQGDILYVRSLAAWATGDLEDAAEYGRRALDQIELLRERVAHPILRATSNAKRRVYYEQLIDILMELYFASGSSESAYLEEALATSERNRAQVTIGLLAEAAVDLNRGMDPSFATARKALYDELAEKRQQQERAGSSKELQELSSDMDKIENRINLLETEYRRKNPNVIDPASAETLNAAEIQQQIDGDTLLLQYALSEQQSYVWAVTSDSIHGFALPGRRDIEEAARRVYENLRSAPGLRRLRTAQNEILALSEMVLGPVGNLIGDKHRLLIAADGALQYIPFAVLAASPDDAARSYQPLILLRDDMQIASVASMTARGALGDVGETQDTQGSIAIFADPVMELSDSRFREQVAKQPSETATPGQLDFRSGDGASLSRIPYTGFEADSIYQLAGDRDTLLARGFDANLDAVLNKDLSDYRYIHFATHGIVDAERPALSSLVLSQFDEQGSVMPGHLRLHHIFALQLNADVVVLSACETGLGRQIQGEGLIGLTQGFMYAGARNLVASLWKVPDRATSELMTLFYSGLLRDNLSPSLALARAQRALAAKRTRSDPFFWGAFVIQGNSW